MSEKQIHYVYIYLDPRKQGNFNYGEYHFDYEPFYVGKGKCNRAWDHLKENQQIKNKRYYRIQKILKEGYSLEPIILIKNLSDTEACNKEKEIIFLIGREDIGLGPLLNLTDGGEGLSGHIFSQESKEKMSLNNAMNYSIPYDYMTEEQILLQQINIKLAWINKTEEELTLFKQKMSNLSKGENNPMYGKDWRKDKTEEELLLHKQRISNAMKGDKNPMYGKNALENKTQEELQLIREKKSKSMKGWLNKKTQEEREQFKERCSQAAKDRWKERKKQKEQNLEPTIFDLL